MCIRDRFKEAFGTLHRARVEVFRGFLDSYSIPVAEGTVRYLKEIGQWTSGDDQWNQQAIELQNKYVEAWQAASAQAEKSGVEIDAENEKWIELWEFYTEPLDLFEMRL